MEILSNFQKYPKRILTWDEFLRFFKINLKIELNLWILSLFWPIGHIINLSLILAVFFLNFAFYHWANRVDWIVRHLKWMLKQWCFNSLLLLVVLRLDFDLKAFFLIVLIKSIRSVCSWAIITSLHKREFIFSTTIHRQQE